MTPEHLAARHPRLFHQTDPSAWPLIEAHGLLPASELVRRAGADVEALTRTRRPREVRLDADFGRVTINDNIPLSERALEGCLTDGLTPADWCATLAARVFFWTEERHLARLLDARTNRKRPRLVLVLDTLSFARAHVSRIELSPINSGSTIRKPAPRGLHTFAPMRAFDSYRDWAEQRMRLGLVTSRDTVKEVVVPGAVEDAAAHVAERRLYADGAYEVVG